MIISLYLRNCIQIDPSLQCIDTEHIDVLNQRKQSFSRENTYTSKWEQHLKFLKSNSTQHHIISITESE